MKKIHLIRHAKSNWEDGSLADIDRPLSELGINACLFMAQHIVDAGCCFDNVFCSPAVRAQTTIELISSGMSEADVKWQTDEKLYTFSSNSLFRWFRDVDDSISEVLIIGHNPAFTEFCNEISDSDIRNIPTCGYAQLVLPQDCQWQEISEISAELTTFLKPKKLMQE